MPKPYLAQNPFQPTKTTRKHPIKSTKSPFWALTLPGIPVIIADAGFSSGEMAEWLKALVLKTSDVERHRGFESLSLRQTNTIFGMEKYPRGRRGSPAKGVGCDKRRPGSNPGFSAKPPKRAVFCCPWECTSLTRRVKLPPNADLLRRDPE